MPETRILLDVEATAEFRVIIDEDRAPADLFTRAENVEEFQNHLYGDAVKDRETVLKHWAYNAIFNNVDDPSRLDGWGDLERGIVTFYVGHPNITESYETTAVPIT